MQAGCTGNLFIIKNRYNLFNLKKNENNDCCICHNISDRKIKEIMLVHGDEIHHLKDLKKKITICQQCGKCKDDIKLLIKKKN